MFNDSQKEVFPPFDPNDLSGKKFSSETVTIHFVDGRRVEISAFGVLISATYLPTGTPYLVAIRGNAAPGGAVSGSIHIGYATIGAGPTYAISMIFDQNPTKPLTYPYDLL